MNDRRGGRGGWQPRGDNKFRPYGSSGGWRGGNRGGWRGGGGNPRGNYGGGGGNWNNQNPYQNQGGGGDWNRGRGRGFQPRGNRGGGRGRGGQHGPIDGSKCVMPAMWANPWAKLEAEYEKEYGIPVISEFSAEESKPVESHPFPAAGTGSLELPADSHPFPAASEAMASDPSEISISDDCDL